MRLNKPKAPTEPKPTLENSPVQHSILIVLLTMYAEQHNVSPRQVLPIWERYKDQTASIETTLALLHELRYAGGWKESENHPD